MKWYWWALIALALAVLAGGGLVAYQIEEAGKPYLDAIKASAAKYGIPWPLMAAEIWQESRFDPSAVSPVGALGIAQFMPATAADLGIDPLDPFESIDAMGHYLNEIKSYLTQALGKTPDWSEVLAAYNWGMGSVRNAVTKYGTAWLDHAPAETQTYVGNIMGAIAGFV